MLSQRVQFPLVILLLLVVSRAEAGEQRMSFSSSEQRVTLIELFTSEGCSSCPPADRWLTNLKAEPGLWKSFVPVAFHVDYWDYIGWQDRFASAEYSARQRQYAEEGAATVVYTPGVFRAGKDWRGWRSTEKVSMDGPKTGELSVTIANGTIEIRFASQDAETGPLTAHVALLGMNLQTNVRTGENRGRNLNHDFVALGTLSVPLEQSGSDHTATTRLPDASTGAKDLALAVWVSPEGTQRPIQAVGGYL